MFVGTGTTSVTIGANKSIYPNAAIVGTVAGSATVTACAASVASNGVVVVVAVGRIARQCRSIE